MAAALLLDLLIFVVPLLLIPIGLWRGGAHEGFVGAGILLGWSVATGWAGAWGGALADLFNVADDGMRLLVSLVVLVLGAGLGHAAGAVVGLPTPEADGRIAGAFLAWLNGVLFLTLALGIYAALLGATDLPPIIERGVLTQAVIEHQRWVLLGVAVAVAGLIGTVAWVNAVVGEVYDPGYVPGRRTVFTAQPPPDADVLLGADPPLRADPAPRADPRQPMTTPYTSWPAAVARSRPVANPREADSGKVEPSSRLRSAIARLSPESDRPRPGLREVLSQTVPVDIRGRITGRHQAARPEWDHAPGSALAQPMDVPRPRMARPGESSSAAESQPDEASSSADAPASPSAAANEWIRISGLRNPMFDAPTADRTDGRTDADATDTPDPADPDEPDAPAVGDKDERRPSGT